MLSTACSSHTAQGEAQPSDTTNTCVHCAEPECLYGIPIDSFDIENHTVGRNDVLSAILARAGVPAQAAIAANNAAKDVFDFRTIRRGNSYTLFFSPDTLHQLRHFVYSIDARHYVTCTFGDTITVSQHQHNVRKVRREAAATISTSLWNATTDAGLSPALALELSDIFAWTVDFFGIEKGDYFKVIFTENYIDSTAIGIDNIEAALFVSHGRPFYAFRFTNDSTESYFDLEGNSLRKAFLKAPLKFSRISSRFSHGRMHPVLKIRRPHHGVDYAAPSGTPVYTIGDGRVIAKGWDKKGGGNYVKIKHNSVYTSVYMHLRGFAKGIATGSNVKQGDLIGTVGATGLATGPHLDFRVYMNNKPIDPLKMEAPPVEPVSNDNIQTFINYSDSVRTVLDAIRVEL